MKSISESIACIAVLSLLIAGCSPSGQDATTASQPDTSQAADATIAQDFEPEYIGGWRIIR